MRQEGRPKIKLLWNWAPLLYILIRVLAKMGKQNCVFQFLRDFLSAWSLPWAQSDPVEVGVANTMGVTLVQQMRAGADVVQWKILAEPCIELLLYCPHWVA